MQLYKFLDGNDLHVDRIDSSLDYIRLKWKRAESWSEQSTSKRVYGLIPADSSRKLVHIVRADECMDKLSSKLSLRKQIKELPRSESSWTSHVFYVNHYLSIEVTCMTTCRNDHKDSYTKLFSTWNICNLMIEAVFYYGFENISTFFTRKGFCRLRDNKKMLLRFEIKVISNCLFLTTVV